MSTLTARPAHVKQAVSSREVNCIDWSYRILGLGVDAAPNHRTLAIALLNEDSQLGRRFVPPAPIGAVAVKTTRKAVSDQFGRAVTAFLGRMGYTDAASAAVVSWFEYRGSFTACPVLNSADAAILADAVQALRDRQDESGMVADRPFAVAHSARDFEPSRADSRWWAAESASMTSERVRVCRQKRTAGRLMGRDSATSRVAVGSF